MSYALSRRRRQAMDNPGIIVDVAIGAAAGAAFGYLSGWLLPLTPVDWNAATQGHFTLKSALLVSATVGLPVAATVLWSPAAGVGAFAGEVLGHRLAPGRAIVTMHTR